MSKPHSDNQPEVTTYFELQRNRDGLPEPGESKPAPVVPRLPPTSPWHHDPCGDEPLVDRSEDSDVMGVAIDHLP
jgi:hypothetical protein